MTVEYTLVYSDIWYAVNICWFVLFCQSKFSEFSLKYSHEMLLWEKVWKGCTTASAKKQFKQVSRNTAQYKLNKNNLKKKI